MAFRDAPRAFLSYARKDGEDFATALRHRLETECPEITLWQDRTEMEGGVGWWSQIEAALDHVRFLVIVLTPRSLASPTTQQEWRYARQRGVNVYPVKGVPDDRLDYDALPSWMRKAHFFDVGDWTGTEWRDVKEWQTFVNYLRSDRQPSRVPFLAPELPRDFINRPHEFDALVSAVLNPDRSRPTAITTSLQGAGGYGKTTLAIALCHDERVDTTFDDGILWASLGQRPNVRDELARWYEALTGLRPPFIDIADAATKLAEKLAHLECLLVIDDVWDSGHLEPFLRGGPRCARVVTTRRVDLLKGAPRIRVDRMTSPEARHLLASVFTPGTASQDTLARLVAKLGQWPLLLKLASGMIRARLDRGDSAKGAVAFVELLLDRRGVIAFDAADTSRREDAVRGTIAASRSQLDPADDRRLLDLAVFRQEAAIPLTTLGRMWQLDALETEECAQRLDDVGLLAVNLQRGTVTLHAVMTDYLERQVKDFASLHARLVTQLGEPLQLPDTYAWRWLPYHLRRAGHMEALRELLMRPDWLQAQLVAVGPYAVLQAFGSAELDSDLRIVHAVLRLSLPTLATDARQFCEQLLGRLRTDMSSGISTFRQRVQALSTVPRLHARWPNLLGPGNLEQTFPHRAAVRGAVALPDARVLSWTADGTLHMWDLATGEGRVLADHEQCVAGALPLQDERVLFWGDDGTLHVWDESTGDGRTVTGPDVPVHGALLLPDSRVVSWGGDSRLHVSDLTTGEQWILNGHEGPIYGALLLASGQILSWSADTTLRVWDITSGVGRALIGHRTEAIGAIALPNAHVLSWSSDGAIRKWDLATCEGRLLRNSGDVIGGAFLLPDGRPLCWSSEGLLRVEDEMTGAGRVITSQEEGPISGAMPLSDGRVLCWRADGTLHVRTLTTGEDYALSGHEGQVSGTLLLPDGRVMSWSVDRTLRVWNVTMQQHRDHPGHERAVSGALLLPERRVLSWSGDRFLRAWNAATGASQALTAHESAVSGALLLSDGRALSWSEDRTLRVADVASGEVHVLTGHQDWVHGALLLSDGQVLSWSLDGTLRVWDVRTGRGRALSEETIWVSGALALPDAKVLSWGIDPTLRLWDVTTGGNRKLAGHQDAVYGARPLPDGRVLSWSADGTLRIWDLATGEGLALIGHERPVSGALLLSDGGVLSWGQDPALRVWDVATGEGRALIGHLGWVNGALVLPDGRVLSWSLDATLRVWDTKTGESHALIGHESSVFGALLLSDDRVLSWSDDRSIRCWDLERLTDAERFYFDGGVKVVMAVERNELFVGDALGHVHFIELMRHAALV